MPAYQEYIIQQPDQITLYTPAPPIIAQQRPGRADERTAEPYKDGLYKNKKNPALSRRQVIY